jgi:hypothetical protein
MGAPIPFFTLAELEAAAQLVHRTVPPTPQYALKPDVRLEWRGQHRQNEADQRDHRANLADSIIR